MYTWRVVSSRLYYYYSSWQSYKIWQKREESITGKHKKMEREYLCLPNPSSTLLNHNPLLHQCILPHHIWHFQRINAGFLVRANTYKWITSLALEYYSYDYSFTSTALVLVKRTNPSGSKVNRQCRYNKKCPALSFIN